MKTPNFPNFRYDTLAKSKPYLRAVRPRMGLFAIAWLTAGYFRFDVPVNFEAIVTVFTVALLTSSIVVLNDFCDRNHDRKKGRLLASEAPGPFLAYTITLWILTGWGVYVVSRTNTFAAVALAIISLIGCFYSWFRRIPLLSGVAVGLSYGGLAIVAAVSTGSVPPDSLWGAAAVAIFVFTREILYDLDDISIDAGYKFTLPVLSGTTNAKYVSAICLIAALSCALVISPWMGLIWIPVLWYLPWLLRPGVGDRPIDSLLHAQAIGFLLLYALTPAHLT